MAQPAPIEQSALLVIDIQDSFKLGPRWERRTPIPIPASRGTAPSRNRFARIARVEELVGELEKAALPCNG